jgi:hypothetical protein
MECIPTVKNKLGSTVNAPKMIILNLNCHIFNFNRRYTSDMAGIFCMMATLGPCSAKPQS